jgi:hypothetical protein
MNDPNYNALIKSLNGKHPYRRKDARAQLKSLTPEQLVKLAEIDSDNQKRRRSRLGPFFWLSYLLFLPFCLIPKSVLPKQLEAVATVFSCLFMGIGICYIWSFYGVRNAVAETIAHTEDTCFVPAALEALARCQSLRKYFTRTRSGPVEASLRAVLKRLMPRLRPGQLDAWTIQQRRALLVPLIEPAFDVELTLCVLKALEQVGGEWALSHVEKLTKLTGKGPEARIRFAAEECLPTLKEIADQERLSSTLLRPVLTAEDQAAVLLRPAVGTTAVTEPLLRAVE